MCDPDLSGKHSHWVLDTFLRQVLIFIQNFERVGGFHMQGISGRSDSELCFALNNAADGSLRLAQRVKINKIKWFLSFIVGQYFDVSIKLN